MTNYLNISFTILLMVVLACKTPKLNFPETDQTSICSDLNKIDSLVLQEISFKRYFSIADQSNVNYYRNRYIHPGYPRSFVADIADLRHKADTNKSVNEQYDSIVRDLLKYQAEKKVIEYTCKKNSISREDADFEINYWYNPADCFYSIEIVRILKTPGHTQGYLFLVNKTMNNFNIIRTSYWTE